MKKARVHYHPHQVWNVTSEGSATHCWGGGDGREVGGEGEGRKRRGRRRERVNEEKTKDGKVGERTEKEKKG